ncbi:MAG: S8 family serine peptidase [Sphingobacteriales bacterium]|jgi:subtilisin family serine protease|nr:S8 family serine peptidase [Sphingobacteriales bacterium]MCC7057074.1 S8 family serine peptidase [Chitinophagales bacterium]MDA0198767.1 S8 family serine peptidase [Bacteroidota bacterium]MBK6889558.1 S8 family serine peptidase [Sphingobacteriales bacterium]MBK7527938.1 S8 family serine peptidase [Sphingobacteriales bacterium]
MSFLSKILAFIVSLFKKDNTIRNTPTPPANQNTNTTTSTNNNTTFPSPTIEINPDETANADDTPNIETTTETNPDDGSTTSIEINPDENTNNEPNTEDSTSSQANNDLSSSGDIIIRYGNSYLKLTKSKQYFAVLPTPGTVSRSLTRSINVRNGSSLPQPDTGIEKMGDFELHKPAERNIDAVETALDNMRQSPGVEIGTHVYHFADKKDQTPIIPTGELYIQFTPDSTAQERQAIIDEFALNIVENRDNNDCIAQLTAASPNPIKITLALQQNNCIAICEPDLQRPANFANFTLPADDLFKDQWHLANSGKATTMWGANLFKAGSDAKAVQAWQHLQSLGNPNLVVAVIDNGFDMKHPDLVGDGNKIVHPYNFMDDNTDPSPKIGDWHGTPCASVAVGAANGKGVVGACPNAKLMPLKFTYVSDSQIEKWFNWCIDKGADVVSNSWGIDDMEFTISTRMLNAITRCATKGRNGKGCVIVFASGNSNVNITDKQNPETIKGFATHPGVIAVAASNSKDARSDYSNYGRQISVCAPSNGTGGAGILAADVSGVIELPSGQVVAAGDQEGNYDPFFGGTSSACPLVAGVCALILTANPNLTASQVKAILETTCDKIGDPNSYDSRGHSIYVGYGRINAYKAVLKATGQDIPADNPAGNIDDAPPVPELPPPPPPAEDLPAQTLPFLATNELTNLKPGTEILFKLTIGGALKIATDSPVGDDDHDFDMYIRRGANATRGINDLAANDFGSNVEKTITNPVPGAAYFVLITAYQGSGGFNIYAEYPQAKPQPGCTLLQLKALGGGRLHKEMRPDAMFKLSSSEQLNVTISTLTAEQGSQFTLYIKKGAPPQWNNHDAKAQGDDFAEANINKPSFGDYYVMLRCEKGGGSCVVNFILT